MWEFEDVVPCWTKTDRIGVIFSLIICCKFEFLKDTIDDAIIEKVNSTLRSNNENFINKDAAKDVYDDKVKKPLLKSNPFVRCFEYSKVTEGYQDGSNTAIQLKDYIDYLHILFPGDELFNNCRY